MNRDEQLAQGLAQLQKDMAHVTRHIAAIQSLVPVIEFDDMVESDERANDQEAVPLNMGYSSETETVSYPTYPSTHQLPMFDYEPPIKIVFENVIINGEVVNLETENVDGSDS